MSNIDTERMNTQNTAFRVWWRDMRATHNDINIIHNSNVDSSSIYNTHRDPPVVTGMPVEPDSLDYQDINQEAPIPQVTIPMIEVEEISTEGWLCLIVGCFLCPGFNLLGLCMKERRLVPATNVAYVF